MTDNPQKSGDGSAPSDIPAIGGPVRGSWCEWTLARAEELEALSNFWVRPRDPHFWVRPRGLQNNDEVLTKAICSHLNAARQAAQNARLDPPKWFRFRIVRPGSRIERARINLDAAEAHLLTLAPNTYILGQMPCLLNHVQRHLPPTDARRQEFERIARKLGIADPDHLLLQQGKNSSSADKDAIVTAERRKITSIVRGASSAALREYVRLASFRNVVVITAALMAVLAIGVAITGLLRPTLIPMCFAPEQSGVVTVVCPTHQSQPFVSYRSARTARRTSGRHRRCNPGDRQTTGSPRDRTRRAHRSCHSNCRRHPPSQGLVRTVRPACFPRRPQAPRLARSPLSSACCSCVANSSPASAHWIRPRRSLPGRWSSGTRNSCSPALSISKAKPYSTMCAAPTRPQPAPSSP